MGTHSGTFHCDEALAVYMLRQTSTYKDSPVKRTRDPAILETCDIVVDVGGVYDESKQRFDHHQRGFTEVLGHGFNTKLSSAGLVYKHFGKELISLKTQLPVDHPNVHTLWLKLYENFIESIDGIDNGIDAYTGTRNYKIRTDLSSRVSRCNPSWREPSDAASMDARFEKASGLTGEEFSAQLSGYADDWLPAREIVIKSIEKSKKIDPTGRIVVFDQFVPWKEHVMTYEEENNLGKQFLYGLFQDDSSKQWRVTCVPQSHDGFANRKPLPEAWRGFRDEELSKISDIPGCVFVHIAGFTGGNRTYEGALAMAKYAAES
ncbi:metal-dependent protein hydrolase [Fistulina hepatica ATCC 64428]|uniref:Metal-dependent protein hydrolase n=1 Tax=Fistulina hepatica ATCC 64428 TaxID=1128425 RepID=A0A0D7AMH3_9AGAR|nr:metal-dependent protein hydrolase [Fistulina hepatica ATCC 64428]